MNWYEEVLKRKNDLLLDLTRLLQIESTKDSETAAPEEPMGKNVAKALDYMLELSSQQGMETKNHEGFYGYAELKGATNDEHVAVLCHIDVVPATGEWTSPPFEPTIREGKLYARGAIDDKGPTMAAFYAVKLINELQLPLKRNVRVIFGTDEESGMSCLKTYREVEQPPVAGFAPDATFPIINAEKGQIHVKCGMTNVSASDDRSQSPFTLRSFASGTRANMVPETATAIVHGDVSTISAKFISFLESNDLQGESSINGEEITFNLKGLSTHSMEPFKGKNAAVHLAHFLNTLSLDASGKEYLSFIDTAFYEDHYGKNLGINHSDEITGPLTVNPAIFQYEGTEGFVQLNIRYPVTAQFETIESTIQHALEVTSFTVDEIRNKNPHHVDKDTPMIRSLQLAYKEETGNEPTLLSSGGNTYASLLPNCVAYGAVFPGKEMTAHQKDEYIEVDDLLKAAAIYARAIYNLANMEG